jgi:hypothetical protein
MRGWVATLIILLIAAFGLVFFLRSADHEKPQRAAPSVVSNSVTRNAKELPQPVLQAQQVIGAASGPANSAPFSTSAVAAAASGPAEKVPPVPPTPESSSLPAQTVLENMRSVIRQYGAVFGGNPVGNNAEITKALQGENPKHVNFLKSDDGNRVNAAGELVDVWGTPYFFHQLSGTQMEIHSAGPDRRMWTADDLVIQ